MLTPTGRFGPDALMFETSATLSRSRLRGPAAQSVRTFSQRIWA
jgi:hypothetical protein